MDTTKLPKWAQQEIDRLERNVEYWKARATAGPNNSNTFVRNSHHDDDTPLGAGPIVRFFPGPGRGWADVVEVNIVGDQVRVCGGDLLGIFPSSSNSFTVKPMRWNER